MSETDNQIRLRRSKEALSAFRESENRARKVLADAVEATKTAKYRYEALFAEEERQEVKRREASYRHVTN